MFFHNQGLKNLFSYLNRMTQRLSLRERKNAHLKWSQVHAKVENLPAIGKEIWDGFDEIVCINLNERQDRYEKVKSVFDSFGIPVKFHRVDKHPNGGVEGCYTSHIQVITSAYERGLQNILIFEDDVVPGKGLNARKIIECENLMKVPGVQIVYLGWHPMITKARTTHLFGSMYGVKAMGCHAYALTRETMGSLANRPFDGTPIDVVLTQYSKAFGVYPTAFVQGMGDSNITNNLSNSKVMKPVRAVIEAWSINVNCPPQWIVKSVIIAVACLIVFRSVIKSKNLEMDVLSNIMVFLTAFMISMFIFSR
jgi:glycosyl transferase family 25